MGRIHGFPFQNAIANPANGRCHRHTDNHHRLFFVTGRFLVFLGFGLSRFSGGNDDLFVGALCAIRRRPAFLRLSVRVVLAWVKAVLPRLIVISGHEVLLLCVWGG